IEVLIDDMEVLHARRSLLRENRRRHQKHRSERQSPSRKSVAETKVHHGVLSTLMLVGEKGCIAIILRTRLRRPGIYATSFVNACSLSRNAIPICGKGLIRQMKSLLSA